MQHTLDYLDYDEKSKRFIYVIVDVSSENTFEHHFITREKAAQIAAEYREKNFRLDTTDSYKKAEQQL